MMSEMSFMRARIHYRCLKTPHGLQRLLARRTKSDLQTCNESTPPATGWDSGRASASASINLRQLSASSPATQLDWQPPWLKCPAYYSMSSALIWRDSSRFLCHNMHLRWTSQLQWLSLQEVISTCGWYDCSSNQCR